MSILTEEERLAVWTEWNQTDELVAGLQRRTEAAVLEKLRQQEPFAWHSETEGLSYENHYSNNVPLYASPVPAAVPDGWSIKRAGDAFIVQKDGVGGYVARENEDNIASEILYRLADSMLSVAPAMQETANTNSERISSKLVNGAKGGE